MVSCLPHAFTDYRRKWDTIQQADLDGGSYSENFGDSTILIVISRCFYCLPVENWYGPLIPLLSDLAIGL